MSEELSTNNQQELPPEVLNGWELTEADREFLEKNGIDGARTGKEASMNNSYSKLSEADEASLDSQDFFNKPEVENPYSKLSEADEASLDSQALYESPIKTSPQPQPKAAPDSDTNKETEIGNALLDFEPTGKDGTYVVKRTSGDMDDGWFPYSKEEVTNSKSGEKYWEVTVYKDTNDGRLSKTVKIDDLRGWNAPVTETAEAKGDSSTDLPPEEQVKAETKANSEEQELAEAELKAGEILSFSQQLRIMIRESASENVTATQTKLNEARAFLGRPRTKLLESRLATAQKKYDRLSARQDKSRFGFINRRNERKAGDAFLKLQESINALENRNNILKSREHAVAGKGEDRHEAIEQRKQDLINNRIEAEKRKQIRAEQRSRRLAKIEGETFQERERRVKLFTPEDERRMRELAIKAIKSRN